MLDKVDFNDIEVTQEWDKIFPKSNKVNNKKVIFKNRYGITLVGDLYTPKDKKSEKLSAIVICGPFGAVKEQASGFYAQIMAERGFITLAFDPSYTGESSGEPRHLASPEINTEDFSAAIDFLGLQSDVNRDSIGVIGICGFGGMALSVTAMDTRIKAVATTVMYDMSRAMGHGVGFGKDRYDLVQRKAVLNYLNKKRWIDAENGFFDTENHDIYVLDNGDVVAEKTILPESLPENPNPVLKDFYNYYRTKLGYHKNSVNSTGAWNATMPLSFMNFPLLTYISEISPRPILIVAGEKAHSLYFSQDAYKAASELKELVIIPEATHVDLYYDVNKIPFDKLEIFFNNNLK
ncbi:alpha/beta hydrolase (plasmid) [Cetobacterium somerae]|uniref:alpha/beta hydrolase n=1 Tax=Cetobacterium somerae TaxID=188913 RepID=UPI003D76947B